MKITKYHAEDVTRQTLNYPMIMSAFSTMPTATELGTGVMAVIIVLLTRTEGIGILMNPLQGKGWKMIIN